MIRRRFALRSFRLEMKAVFLGLKHPCFFILRTWSHVSSKPGACLREFLFYSKLHVLFYIYIYPVNGGLGVKGFTPPCLYSIYSIIIYILYIYSLRLFCRYRRTLPHLSASGNPGFLLLCSGGKNY